MSERFLWNVRPLALKQNIVVGENYRFTILTDRLIRCEFSANGIFEDRASQSVFYRDFTQVEFETFEKDKKLTIETKSIKLNYTIGEMFSEDSLVISLKNEPATVWHYGDIVENLGGTSRTLDTINGAMPLNDGVCSRYGCAVIDDSNTMLLNEEGWVEVRNKDTIDFYFFGYGYDYLEAVKDYYRLTGIPPMLPDYAFGNWWSRYHCYTQEEYIELMERFKSENIPFSVGVVDMDWHITKIPDNKKDKTFPRGWTGYTWNEELFPDYKAFLKYLNENNISTALNLHPAAGVCPHEKQYKEMARICEIEPSDHHRVPFDILSPKYMAAYFDILHHPYEEDGVNFWWMDWQQGTNYWWIHEKNENGNLKDEREVLDPLWMLNHLHILDICRDGKRPMFFSRYCGPGSQRYPVGFSGDTIATWKSLEFQPYFTATASNIGYTWWSHDIGGHMFGYRDDEMTIRWIQFGVFSPINRLHSANNDFIRKEPWCYCEESKKILCDWLRLRHRLFPYLYTMNYRNHNDLEPLIQPMYYKYPKCSAAYDIKNQYFFGSELMVSPITEKNSSISKLGKAKTFFPKGEWFDFFSGLRYYSDKNRVMDVFRKSDAYPVFAKPGAIVPLKQLKNGDNTLTASDSLEVIVFPGASNTFNLYEDRGEFNNFENGEFVTTKLQLEYGNEAIFKINKSEGITQLIPSQRNWKISFRGFNKNCKLILLVDGVEQKASYNYDALTNSLELQVEAKISSDIEVKIIGEQLITDNGSLQERCTEILQKAELSIKRKVCISALISSSVNIHKKVTCINVETPAEQDLIDALIEQLTLTNDEFEVLTNEFLA